MERTHTHSCHYAWLYTKEKHSNRQQQKAETRSSISPWVLGVKLPYACQSPGDLGRSSSGDSAVSRNNLLQLVALIHLGLLHKFLKTGTVSAALCLETCIGSDPDESEPSVAAVLLPELSPELFLPTLPPGSTWAPSCLVSYMLSSSAYICLQVPTIS